MADRLIDHLMDLADRLRCRHCDFGLQDLDCLDSVLQVFRRVNQLPIGPLWILDPSGSGRLGRSGRHPDRLIDRSRSAHPTWSHLACLVAGSAVAAMTRFVLRVFYLSSHGFFRKLLHHVWAVRRCLMTLDLRRIVLPLDRQHRPVGLSLVDRLLLGRNSVDLT